MLDSFTHASTRIKKSPQDVILCYEGILSQNIIISLLGVIRLQLKKRGVPAQSRYKLCSSFVEMTQNILRYSAVSVEVPAQYGELRYGSISLTTEGGKYFMLCSNPVFPGSVQKLGESLERLCSMTISEIEHAYRHSLCEPSPTLSKGANRGLLTIARNSCGPIKFAVKMTHPNRFWMLYLEANFG